MTSEERTVREPAVIFSSEVLLSSEPVSAPAGIADRLLAEGGAAELSDEFVELLAEKVAKGVAPYPGTAMLVRDLQGRSPIGLVANAPRRVVDRALETVGLAGAFDVVVCDDDVGDERAETELYLAAKQRLGAKSTAVVALVGSPAGAAAAQAANLWVIGIAPPGGLELDAEERVDSLCDPAIRERLGLPGD